MGLPLPRSLGRIAALTTLSGAALAACTLDVTGLPSLPGAISTGGGGGGGAVTATASVTAAVTASSAASSSSGAAPICGDGHLDPGEDCDDGALDPGDGCSPSCAEEKPDACPGVLLPLT